MHEYRDILGDVVKQARQQANVTVEALAEKAGVTPRYIYRIENEGNKPSYDVLFKIIRELSISSDSIFYPEKVQPDSRVLNLERLVRQLYNCDERSIEVIEATTKALLDTAHKNRPLS